MSVAEAMGLVFQFGILIIALVSLIVSLNKKK